MPQIVLYIDINAPIQTCFDLARDAAFHVETARESGERIVEGKSRGVFERGDEVTFEGRHLGVRQRLSAKIIEMNAPYSFADEMTRGIFAQLRHVHRFETLPNGQTRMTDILIWRSPWGILGRVADRIAVEAHLRRFLKRRGERIKARAEMKN
ncbi:MAG: SRPBCC family protein [Armatimonadetes bacterium]|nr:SRPBCC family protein [Armatimonadota bacterium]